MKYDLEPCPFCGNDIIRFGHETEYSTYGTIFAYCTECLAQGAPKPSKQEAADAWNRRKL